MESSQIYQMFADTKLFWDKTNVIKIFIMLELKNKKLNVSYLKRITKNQLLTFPFNIWYIKYWVKLWEGSNSYTNHYFQIGSNSDFSWLALISKMASENPK